MFGLPFWPALAGYFAIGSLLVLGALRTGLAARLKMDLDIFAVFVWPVVVAILILGEVAKIFQSADRKGRQRVIKEKDRERQKQKARDELGV